MQQLQDTEENTDDSELKVYYCSTSTLIHEIRSFQKVLGTKDLVSLGIGSCVGTGMYLVSGMVARTIAGPAVVLSYAVAGFAALLSGNANTLH